MLFFVFFSLMVSFLLGFISMLISKKMFLDREKLSIFECGFDVMSSSRLPFSIHFYLIGILFLIFDVEIVFLFPIIDLMENLNYYDWVFLSFMILLILLLGLEYEKKEGTLKWFF